MCSYVWRKFRIGSNILERNFSTISRITSIARYMSEELCTTPGSISLESLSLAGRHDWRDTRVKWPLARNLVRSWWNIHTSLNLWSQKMAPCTRYQITRKIYKIYHILSTSCITTRYERIAIIINISINSSYCKDGHWIKFKCLCQKNSSITHEKRDQNNSYEKKSKYEWTQFKVNRT